MQRVSSVPSSLKQDDLAGAASRLAALVSPYRRPACAVVAPGQPRAALRDLLLRQRRRATGRRRPARTLVILAVLLASCGATVRDTRDDLTTTTQVKIALLEDARLGALRLTVKTFQGVVTIGGVVASAAEQDRAIAI